MRNSAYSTSGSSPRLKTRRITEISGPCLVVILPFLLKGDLVMLSEFNMAPTVSVLSVFLYCMLGSPEIPVCHGQADIVTGSFTIEQPGNGNCFTFYPAAGVLDEDRVILTRCRDRLPDGTQTFSVHALVDDGKFSLATADKKCLYGDSRHEFRRSTSLCDKNLNHFVTERILQSVGRAGSDILIKHWPSDLCVTSKLDASINLAPCDPANPRQRWKVCRSDDSEMCLRYYER